MYLLRMTVWRLYEAAAEFQIIASVFVVFSVL